MLSIENLSFSYRANLVLNDISFNVEKGKIKGLIGPNGSGKSTLLKNILYLERPVAGKNFLNNITIEKMTLKERAKNISYVPQFTTPNFPHSVFYTVLMGRKPYIGWNYAQEDEKKTHGVLKQMGLDELSERLFSNLSGGEKQKVILARAVVQECPVMLLDEPTSNLDLRHKQDLMKALRDMVESQNVSILIAIHDLNLAARFCDEIILLNHGEKVVEGTPREVITKENIEEVYQVKIKIMYEENDPLIFIE